MSSIREIEVGKDGRFLTRGNYRILANHAVMDACEVRTLFYDSLTFDIQ
jgi:hypothetical protein